MNTRDLVASAVSNTFRSKTRTLLTILAIFIGAFTLTITNGLGTGINRYIDDTISSIGATDVMTAVKNGETAGAGFGSDGPTEYDPDAIASGQPGPPGSTVVAMSADDLATLQGIDGVLDAQAVTSITADYIQFGGGTRYVVSVGSVVPGQTVQLSAGEQPDDEASELELALPVSFVEPLGFANAEAAIGQTVSVAVSDAVRTQHVVDAIVVGVSEETFAAGGASIIPNAALTDELATAQNTGLPEAEQGQFAQATVSFDPNASDDEVAALKDRLTDAGYTGTTVADQLGAFRTIIDGIVLVLNAFAIIALLAASFGIVNTLFMSVQERTREIGLMKAMGMGSGRVFSLFSLEAVFIGFLGSAIGAGIGILVGSGLSAVLSGALLADLPGLTLLAFDPVSILTVILLVMAIAFLAGTLPAARAARADPVESLRYE